MQSVFTGFWSARTAVAVSVQDAAGHTPTFRGLRYGGFEAPVRSEVLMFPRFSVALPSLLFHFFTSMDSSSICRIRETYRAIIAFEAYVEEHYDLNLNEAMLLCALSERTQMTAGEVAEALGLTHSNTSKVIASAERQRLIKRRMDKDDKRRMFFTLTPGGEERLATLKSDTMELPELLR